MEETITVIDFGEVRNHYFMEVELIENKPCETHNYTLVKVNKSNPELHCGVCGDSQLFE